MQKNTKLAISSSEAIVPDVLDTKDHITNQQMLLKHQKKGRIKKIKVNKKLIN